MFASSSTCKNRLTNQTSKLTKSYCGDFLPEVYDDYDDSGENSELEGYESPEILPQSKETPAGVRDDGNSSCRQLFGNDVSNTASEDPQSLILEEIKKTNISLQSFSTRMDEMDKRLQSIENQQKVTVTPSSSADTDNSEKKKRSVPTRVRVSH